MKKRIQIFIMILTLGMFITPTQNLFAKSETMNCCSTEKKDDSSCHDQKESKNDCNKNHSSHDGCGDSCCTSCNGCHTFFIPVIDFSKDQKITNSIFTAKKSDFNYTSPHISTGLQEIWQPPKIA